MNMGKFIAKHLSAPKGIRGRVVSYVMNRKNRPIYEKTLKFLDFKDGEKVLDIGCGNGYVLNLLANRNTGTFSGIDISESIIKAANIKNKSFVSEGIMQFDCQNIVKMSFENGSFDKAYTINTVYFWDNVDDAMDEIRRVLKPDGVFVNTVLSNETLDGFTFSKYGYNRYSQEQLTQMGEKAGFGVEVIPLFKGFAYCYKYQKKQD